MLEELKTCKREVGFDRIETAAEMDTQRFRASFDSEPFYTKLYIQGGPIPEEHTHEMRVDVE